MPKKCGEGDLLILQVKVRYLNLFRCFGYNTQREKIHTHTPTHTHKHTHTYIYVSSVAKSCPTLCDPMDCSPPGSSVHGILQAGILEWVTFPSPGDLPNPGIELESLMSPALQVCSLPLVPPGKPIHTHIYKYIYTHTCLTMTSTCGKI